eukprot:TRINITY_DN2763_c0_g1_i1.p1 TRINITY_DN2763_c0_g1~~TRINITY_DN2763_c0_g1_i1.p1  ORF type:complete len:562 (-),score=87.81 TRINITY_DN2763_c0_g1_i1:144-1829(-)
MQKQRDNWRGHSHDGVLQGRERQRGQHPCRCSSVHWFERVSGAEYYDYLPVTLQLIHERGGVCGNISKFGTSMAQAHGVPAMPVGQPGHCAFIYQKSPGVWTLSNDISGWSASNRHDSIQIPWGEQAWMVPMMDHCQLTLHDYSKSERILAAAGLAPIEHRGTMLASAAQICPFNMQVWQARVQYLVQAAQAGHDVSQDLWVSSARSELQNQGPRLISSHKHVASSDPAFASLAHNMVDQSSSEWWTEQPSAWFEIDLEEACHVSSIRIQWWGTSVAKSYRILSQLGDEGFVEQLTQQDESENPSGYNSWSQLPGWTGKTTKVRVELADGSLDGWGMNKWFGIRQFNISGTTADAPTSPPAVMKQMATVRLHQERVAAPTGATAADAGDRVSCSTTVLACAVGFIQESIDQGVNQIEALQAIPVEELSLGKPVRVSSFEDRGTNLVDGTDSEWWTETDTAWFEIDLQQTCTVSGLRVHWWGTSVAKIFKIFSSSDGVSWKQQRCETDAGALSEYCNGWSEVPGWREVSRHVRVELCDGSLDPWGMNKWFGLRNFCVMGHLH